MSNRRDFLRGTAATALSLSAPADLFAQAASTAPASGAWDSGHVRHLLPTASDNRILLKTSFAAPLDEAPTLQVDGTSVRGRMGDTRGEHWHFHADRSAAGTAASAVAGRRATGARSASRGSFRHSRSRRAARAIPRAVLLLRRRPRGDEVPAARGAQSAVSARAELCAAGRRRQRRSCLLGFAVAADLEALRRLAGSRSRSPASSIAPAIVFGGDNETVLKRAAGSADRAGLRRRFPLDADVLHPGRSRLLRQRRGDRRHHHVSAGPFHAAARARHAAPVLPGISCRTSARPRGLAWSSSADRVEGLSETFGTIRYGRLAEVLLYDIRRTATLAGPSAVYIDRRSRELAEGAHGGDRGRPCRACALQSARLDRRQMGRVVSGRSRRRQEADDRAVPSPTGSPAGSSSTTG